MSPTLEALARTNATRMPDVQTTRGVAVQRDPFSLFPQEEPGTGPQASSAGQVTSASVSPWFDPRPSAGSDDISARIQARSAETPAQLEQTGAALDARTARSEPAAIEIGQLEERVSAFEARIQEFVEPDLPLALGETMVDRLEDCAFGAMSQLEAVLAKFRVQGERIAGSVADADHLAEVVSDVETRIATLLEREQFLAHTAERIAPSLADAGYLAEFVSEVETRIATLLEREQSLTHTAERIAPSLADADHLAAVVSDVETRIAALVEQEQSLTHTAERIAPSLADADRLAEVVSGLERRIATLLEQEQSLTRRSILGQPDFHRDVYPAAPLPEVSAEAPESKYEGSPFVWPKRTIGRWTVATAAVGLLAAVAVGSVLLARRPRPPVQAALTQHTTEQQMVAASSPVLPSRALDVPISPAPISFATAAPVTPTIIPAAIESTSGTSQFSNVTPHHRTHQRTHQRTRSPQPARDQGTPPVYAGDLAVQSNPAGGTVFIDHRRVGETPLRLSRLTAGSHVIWIESEGHARWTAAVQVNTDKLVNVSATLQPER
jgi:hypothetical protein